MFVRVSTLASWHHLRRHSGGARNLIPSRPHLRPVHREASRRIPSDAAMTAEETDANGSMSQALQTWLARLFGVERDEAGAVVAGFAMFFLLFAGYFMLRPVRETMGIVGGVENLQWLFTGTFLATLAAMPLFGGIAGGCSGDGS